MALAKSIIAHTDTGSTVYVIIQRETDGFLLNDADGAFANAPADPYVALTEHTTIKGRYDLSESRAVWNDGEYIVTAYKQAGGSPVPASDTVIAEGDIWIISDAEVALDDYANFKATSVTASNMRGTDGANTVTPDNTGIATILTESQTHPTLSEIEASTVLAKEATANSVLTIVTLLNKYVRNKKEIKKDPDGVGSSTKYLIIYDTDGTTEIVRKTLNDSTGVDITDIAAGAMAIEGTSSV